MGVNITQVIGLRLSSFEAKSVTKFCERPKAFNAFHIKSFQCFSYIILWISLAIKRNAVFYYLIVENCLLFSTALLNRHYFKLNVNAYSQTFYDRFSSLKNILQCQFLRMTDLWWFTGKCFEIWLQVYGEGSTTL